MMQLLQFFLLLPFAAAFLPAATNQALLVSRPTTATATASVTSTSSSSTSSLHSSSASSSSDFDGFGSTGFLILAGGTGSRMKANMPKQFMTLRSCPVLHYSLHLFLEKLPAYCASNDLTPPAQVVLVMDPKYQPEYQPIVDRYGGRLAFANPGVERQGSVENGLNKLVDLTDGDCEFVAVHDSARPLVTIPEVMDVVTDAHATGAAVLGVPCKATIKESDDGLTVQRTIPRDRLWEVHTPQVVRVEALLRGFDKVERENLEVTDDVSIIEALGEPVRLTRGEYTNLKITTPEDMDVASAILNDRGEEEIVLVGDGGGSSAAAASPSAPEPSASAPKNPNPFKGPKAAHNRDKAYNSMGDGNYEEKNAPATAYPAKPTPSKWHE